MESQGKSIGPRDVMIQVQIGASGVTQSAEPLQSFSADSVLDADHVLSGGGDSSSASHDRTVIDGRAEDSVVSVRQAALAVFHIVFDTIKNHRQKVTELLLQRPAATRRGFLGAEAAGTPSMEQHGGSTEEQLHKRMMIVRTLDSHMQEAVSQIQAEVHPQALDVLARLQGYPNHQLLLMAMMRAVAQESDRRIPVNMTVSKAEREVQRVAAETWLNLAKSVQKVLEEAMGLKIAE